MTGRCQRVRVGGELSPPEPLHAGVPQGAILSPLLFSLYVNDIVSSSGDCEVNLFADDTSVYVVDKTAAGLQQRLQVVLDRLSTWFRSWAITVNPAMSAFMVLTTKRAAPSLDISLDGTSSHQTATHKHLGVTFNSCLTWSENTDCIVKKASKKIGLLRRIRRRVSHPFQVSYLYTSGPRVACGSWDGLTERNTRRNG